MSDRRDYFYVGCNVLQTCQFVDFVNFIHSQFYTLWIFNCTVFVFFLSTGLVVEGHFDHVSLFIGENAFDSTFKCDDIVHHCAQCLSIVQLHCLSMKLASSEEQTLGIFLINFDWSNTTKCFKA